MLYRQYFVQLSFHELFKNSVFTFKILRNSCAFIEQLLFQPQYTYVISWIQNIVHTYGWTNVRQLNFKIIIKITPRPVDIIYLFRNLKDYSFNTYLQLCNDKVCELCGK